MTTSYCDSLKYQRMCAHVIIIKLLNRTFHVKENVNASLAEVSYGLEKNSVKRSSSFCFQDEIINLAGTEWKIRELVDNWDVSSKNVPLIGGAPRYSLLCRELLRGPNYKQLWRGTVAEWSKALLWKDNKWETNHKIPNSSPPSKAIYKKNL